MRRPHRLFVALLLLPLVAGCGSSSTKTVTKFTTPRPPSATASTATTASNPTTSTSAASTSTGGTTSNTDTQPPPATPVYFEGVVGNGQQRPRTLELTGDGTLYVSNVQWDSWGGQEATGSGNASYHGCNPNCAAAQVHTAFVSIHLSGVRTCSGRSYYSALTLTLSAGGLLDRDYVQRSWSPC